MFNAARVPRVKTNTLTQGWAIDPSLSSRFPLIFAHLYATATPKDIFMGGDSGAAYINPTALYGPTRDHISGLPDAREMWQHINQNLYRQFHYTTTGTLFSRHPPGDFFCFFVCSEVCKHQSTSLQCNPKPGFIVTGDSPAMDEEAERM